MSTSFKGITAAVTTAGVVATLAGSMLIGHAASASDGTAATPSGVTNVQLSAFSTHLAAEIHRGERNGRHRDRQLRERARRKHRAQERHRRAAARRRKALLAAQPSGTPQQMAATLVAQHGWDSTQWGCLDELWTRESDWQPTAENSSSGAYGIPQALPATKMAEAGSDYMTDPLTQIRWGLDYIAADYGSPCGALDHSNDTGYY